MDTSRRQAGHLYGPPLLSVDSYCLNHSVEGGGCQNQDSQKVLEDYVSNWSVGGSHFMCCSQTGTMNRSQRVSGQYVPWGHLY